MAIGKMVSIDSLETISPLIINLEKKYVVSVKAIK